MVKSRTKNRRNKWDEPPWQKLIEHKQEKEKFYHELLLERQIHGRLWKFDKCWVTKFFCQDEIIIYVMEINFLYSKINMC